MSGRPIKRTLRDSFMAGMRFVRMSGTIEPTMTTSLTTSGAPFDV